VTDDLRKEAKYRLAGNSAKKLKKKHKGGPRRKVGKEMSQGEAG